MHQTWMMERGFAFLQFNRDGVLKLTSLFLVQNRIDSGHISRQSGDGQIRPVMASSDVMQAAIFAIRIIETDPASQVSKRLSSGPVRVILVPGNNSPVMSRFAEKLVVPEANGAAQQLRRGNRDSWVPEQVVKAWRDAPRAERMEQNMAGIA